MHFTALRQLSTGVRVAALIATGLVLAAGAGTYAVLNSASSPVPTAMPGDVLPLVTVTVEPAVSQSAAAPSASPTVAASSTSPKPTISKKPTPTPAPMPKLKVISVDASGWGGKVTVWANVTVKTTGHGTATVSVTFHGSKVVTRKFRITGTGANTFSQKISFDRGTFCDNGETIALYVQVDGDRPAAFQTYCSWPPDL